MIWLQIFSGLAVLLLGISRLRRDPRANRQFWIDSAFATLNGGLFAFCGAMLTMLLWQPAMPRWHGLLLFGFLLCWLLYGFVWLTRAGPRFQEPPAWISRRGTWVDAALVGLGACFGLTALLV